ncbi:MAG: hypothetical protein ACRYFU_04960 [Janthinobacterium lividum]
MSTSPTTDFDTAALDPQRSAAPNTGFSSGIKPLLICLPSMTSEAAGAVMAEIANTFRDEAILVATPDQDTEQPASSGLPQLVPYTQPRGEGAWVLNALDFVSAAHLADQRGASGVLLLGTDAASLAPQALRAMQTGLAAGADLALPRFHTAPDDGLVNSALLYPLTRALFGADIRFPLPLDVGLSPRMLTRLASTAQRLGTQGESSLIWPVAEASIAGFAVRQVDGGARVLPQPQEGDLSELFPIVTASLFADVEVKAAYWQRARAMPAARPAPLNRHSFLPSAEAAEEIRPLIEGYRIAFDNLREIWSLVLPPQSLLALKKLSVSSTESFVYPPGLWARTVYDFALAFRMRTLNRGHLLGALTPLYLAWVASFLQSSAGDAKAGMELLEVTATAFELEKPYLVSRWRWPDRFNP